MLQVSSNSLHDVEQIETEWATLGQEIRNLQTQLKEHRVNGFEGTLRLFTSIQRRKQKPFRFCNYRHKSGHTPNWIHKKMRGEEIRKVRYDISFQTKVAALLDYETSDFSCRYQYDQDTDRSLDPEDGNSPTTEPLTTEEEAWQDESNELNPPEPRLVPGTIGMSFNMAKIV